MPIRFVANNPALAPLFVAVGAGIVGSAWFGYHVLSTDSAVAVKRNNLQQWNLVPQDKNTKLYSPNHSFWASRSGLPDPRATFLAGESNASDAASKAKMKVKEIKERH
ncbi:hypothetical protein FRC02_003718 [Tulasnella sp. 418]|nr:hypothetical protein FRC02_003718 [Tulasnella sp. 418]